MSHALLLRLFLSPFFSVHVAIQYLKAYPANIGITHYLTSRLRLMPTRDVEFYWPELCHLLVTTPTGSIALECFILERAEESTHSAMLTFWFMQAALCDLAPTRLTNPQSFLVCQRILLRCHEIIFGDPPPPTRSLSPYPNRLQSSNTSLGRSSSAAAATLVKSITSLRTFLNGDKKLVPGHSGAAFVGMGVVLASTPGMPLLAGCVGKVAVEQGRMEIEGQEVSRGKVEEKEGADAPRPGRVVLVDEQVGTPEEVTGSPESSGSSEEEDDQEDGLWTGRSSNQPRVVVANGNGTSSSPSTPPRSKPLPRDPSATTPSLPIAPHLLRQNTQDPFDQSRHKHHTSNLPSRLSTNKPLAPSRSVPSFSSHLEANTDPSRRSGGGRTSQDSRSEPTTPEKLLELYSFADQTRLLRSHYCRSEVRFLIALEDISNRLLVIPKLARVSALRAELTSLNHMLPAEVCMPTWCESDHGHEEGGETASGSSLKARLDSNRSKAHHRVVRISPGDSVVLNSAERAPYLIHVEVLTGDLDFDPTKRVNRDLLHKIVSGEMKKKVSFGGKSVGSDGIAGFGAPLPDPLPPLAGINSGIHPSSAASASKDLPLPPSRPEPYVLVSEPMVGGGGDISSMGLMEPEEEMDLVEQIYGTNISAKNIGPDFKEASPGDFNPRNKDVDLAVWSRTPHDLALSRSSSLTGRSPSFASPGTPSSRTFGSDVIQSPSPLQTNFPSASHSDPSSSSLPSRDIDSPTPGTTTPRRTLTLDDYSDRMRTAAVMLAQLSVSQTPIIPSSSDPSSSRLQSNPTPPPSGKLSWLPGTGWIANNFPIPTLPSSPLPPSPIPLPQPQPQGGGGGSRNRLPPAEAEAIRERIMTEMIALEEERVERMMEKVGDVGMLGGGGENGKTAEDEGIVRRELNKADPSAAVFSESWSAKKARIRAASPWGHLATWDVLSVIVKTGADLRQEQLATQLIERFMQIWKEENCECWVRYFRILITGDSSGLVETITDSVSVHSIKKAEYGRRMAKGASIVHVSLFDHFVNVYGEPTSARFLRAQRNFIKSLAGYSVATYLLQIKDRHNGNILIDREGHCIHIDFGFMLSNSPGSMGFEAAPFKLTMEYVDIMGGVASPGFQLFKKLFKEGFEAARKHSDEIITIVELMQYNSKLPCFLAFGDQTAQHLRERFQLGFTHQAVDDHLERLIVSSIGSHWTRLYDSFQYYSQSVFM